MTSEIPAHATAADLQRLALERPDLRPAIARHPALYPDLRDWLAALGDPAVDAALTPTTPRRRRVPVWAVVVGAVVLLAGALGGGYLLMQAPRYPQTAPHDRADVDALITALSDGDLRPQSRASRGSLAEELSTVAPTECGVLRSFGISMFTTEEAAVSEDYDVRASAGVADEGGLGWMNARLFVDSEAAEAHLSAVASALDSCPTYTSSSGTWHAERAPFDYGSDIALRIALESASTSDLPWSTFVLVRRDNILVVGNFSALPVETLVEDFLDRVRTGDLAP